MKRRKNSNNPIKAINKRKQAKKKPKRENVHHVRFWCTTNRRKCKTKASRQKQKKLRLLLNYVIDSTENSRSTAISLRFRCLFVLFFTLKTSISWIKWRMEFVLYLDRILCAAYINVHVCSVSEWVCGQQYCLSVCTWHVWWNCNRFSIFPTLIFFLFRSFASSLSLN